MDKATTEEQKIFQNLFLAVMKNNKKKLSENDKDFLNVIVGELDLVQEEVSWFLKNRESLKFLAPKIKSETNDQLDTIIDYLCGCADDYERVLENVKEFAKLVKIDDENLNKRILKAKKDFE